MKYIIICYDKSKYTFPFINCNDCYIYNVYKKPNCNKIVKIIRKIIYFLGFKMSYIFYDEWCKYLLKDNVTFIVFDEAKPYFRLANILARTKNKVFIYFRNPILHKKQINRLKKNFLVYTYSLNDSFEYKINFNETFIPLIDSGPELEIYDCIFVGQNKNRLNLINKIYQIASSPFFWVIKDGNEHINLPFLKEKTEALDYNDYIAFLKQSKAILEILPAQGAGLTLRTAEAVLYNKKLITNNNDLRNDEIFLSGNVLIFDADLSKEDFLTFINEPIRPYSKALVKRFSVEEWLSRFK